MSALAADAALHDLAELLRSLFGDAPVNSPQALEFERARWDLALAMKRIAAGAPTLPNDRSGAGNPSIPDASRSNTLMIKVAKSMRAGRTDVAEIVHQLRTRLGPHPDTIDRTCATVPLVRR